MDQPLRYCAKLLTCLPSRTSQERPDSPELSVASCRTDRSKEPPLTFKDGHCSHKKKYVYFFPPFPLIHIYMWKKNTHTSIKSTWTRTWDIVQNYWHVCLPGPARSDPSPLNSVLCPLGLTGQRSPLWHLKMDTVLTKKSMFTFCLFVCLKYACTLLQNIPTF